MAFANVYLLLAPLSHLVRSMLQCFAVCCSVLQYVAVCCNLLQCVEMGCSVLQGVAVTFANFYLLLALLPHLFRNVLQCVAVCCSVLQCVSD